MNNVIAGNVVSGTTTYGAGVAILGNKPAVLQGNSVLANQALAVEMGIGGGIGISSNSAFSLTTNVIDGNRIATKDGPLTADIHAGGGGVGLRGNGNLQMANNVLRGNTISATADLDALAYGGGVYVSGGGILVTNDLEVISSTVAGNRASFGGGVYLYYPNSNGSGVVHSSVISSNHSTRGGGVFQYAGSLTVEDSAILSNVVEEFEGGGIFAEHASNTDALSVTQSTIGANQATTGAGIYSEIDLRMETTVISNNVAGDVGGGLITRRTAMVVGSAIVGNEAAGYGAALSHESSDAMTLQNVTISGNDAGSAGAVYLDGDVDLTNVTLMGNGPAGIYRQSGGVALVNTIIAGSQGPNCNQPLTSMGHNLEDDDTCGLNPGMDDLIFVDPLLGPLRDSGGATPTHILATGSPAIDAGDAGVCPATDQRGVARPVDGDQDGTPICDIGAYEYEPAPPRYLPIILK